MRFPKINTATKLKNRKKRLFIGAYGFEDRTLGWVSFQDSKNAVETALMFKYVPSKGDGKHPNKIDEFISSLRRLGLSNEPIEMEYNWFLPNDIESRIENYIESNLEDVEEVILDISSMTKFLMLICLCKLVTFEGKIRVIYTEAENYSPSIDEYNMSKEDMAFLVRYPSQGVLAIARAICLSSIRMQGQPVTLIAFTSFNEQLVRHLLGTMNPHRLIFINGKPPRKEFAWRECATQEVHSKLINEYFYDNPLDGNGLLVNTVSTLDYIETTAKIDSIYKDIGENERIICGITGSKMQTVGLFFTKMLHPDIHMEYPTPDSYYVEGLSSGIRDIYEIEIPRFASFISNITRDSTILSFTS